jgi:hypothetical protein
VLWLSMFFLILPLFLFGQVGINLDGTQPHPSAMLDVKSTSKGFLPPRLTSQQRLAIPSPANGLVVYDTDSSSLAVFVSSAWAFLKPFPPFPPVPTDPRRIVDANGDTWVDTYYGGANGDSIVFHLGDLTGPGSIEMILIKNGNGQARLEFPDLLENTFVGDKAGFFTTGGTKNTALGNSALHKNTEGLGNTAVGVHALYENKVGGGNTAVGLAALQHNTIGIDNTAVGRIALSNNTTGTSNTAAGVETLRDNTTGVNNAAYGAYALVSNIAGNNNTAIGTGAMVVNNADNNCAVGAFTMEQNTTGVWNTAVGTSTFQENTTGSTNTAIGAGALQVSLTGDANTAVGFSAMAGNKTGSENTAVGHNALVSNLTGSSNVAVGNVAMFNSNHGSFNTALGFEALLNTTGQTVSNTAVGWQALSNNVSGTNNSALGATANVTSPALFNATAIGYGASVNASNKVRIGNSSVTAIEGQVPFTFPSDGRFKYDVQANISGLDFITRLRPVSYKFNTSVYSQYIGERADMNPGQQGQGENIHTGFIAQEVEEAAKAAGFIFDGVRAPQNSKDTYSLAYSQFVVPLVKAVQEQQNEIEALKSENNQLRQQLNQLKSLEARIQTLENQQR